MLARALESNTTLEEVSVGNLIKGSTVRLKSSGEMCTVKFAYYSGKVGVIEQYGNINPSEFDPIPAVLPVKQLRDNAIAELDFKNSTLGVDGGIMLAAVLKKNASVTKVSAILCAEQANDCQVLRFLQPTLPRVMLVAFGVVLWCHLFSFVYTKCTVLTPIVLRAFVGFLVFFSRLSGCHTG